MLQKSSCKLENEQFARLLYFARFSMRCFPEGEIPRSVVGGQDGRWNFRKEADHGVVADRIDRGGTAGRAGRA